ncbi:hypothetical protein KKA24_01385 [Patescibacteria group bacterium]|nr:hypothetical protein [Patescibacteria group bacterium]
MFNYKRLFLGLLAIVFLVISYGSSCDFFQLLIPIATIIICCAGVRACVQNRFCGLLIFLILSVIVCPLLISGRDMYQTRNSPSQFDTRTGAFISDISYSMTKIVEIATYVKTKKTISLEKKEDNKYPNYYPITLVAGFPFGIIGVLFGKKKNAS